MRVPAVHARRRADLERAGAEPIVAILDEELVAAATDHRERVPVAHPM